jgi:hypothetical protein
MFSDDGRQMSSSPALAVIAIAGCLCLVALTDRPALALDAPKAPGLPVVEVLNCRLEGLAVVCGGGGTLLPNREKKLRKKEPEPTPQAAPSQTQHKSKASSAKSQKGKATTSKGQSGKASPTPSKEEQETPAAASSPEPPAQGEGAEKSTVEHSCPPGTVVLEKPNASGSYCELPSAVPAKAPQPVTTAPQPAVSGSVEIPADIRAATCGPGAAPGACNCPNGSEYTSAACKAAIPYCCAGQVTAEGKPQPVISACGADQGSAMNSVVSAAMAKQLSLGSIRCTNQ